MIKYPIIERYHFLRKACMYKKKFLLIAGMLIGVQAIETQVQATITGTEFKIPTVLPLYGITGTAIALYTGYNFLLRKESLASNKFPEAQAWYTSLIAKYPQANLDKINLIQTPKWNPVLDVLNDFAKKHDWTYSYKYIFMPKDTLKEINFLYKKVLDGYPLDEKEIGKLAGHEFTILHEAGHIKHNDAQTILGSICVLLGTTTAIEYYKEEDIVNTKDIVLSKGFEDPFGKKWLNCTIPGTLTTIATGSFIAALVTILRYQSARADKFAIETADLAALENGLKLFESSDADILYDIETPKTSPYIKGNSFVEMFLQHLVGSVECIVGFTKNQMYLIAKSTKATRFIFDLTQDLIHEGPSVRAQAIKDEINKRQNSNN